MKNLQDSLKVPVSPLTTVPVSAGPCLPHGLGKPLSPLPATAPSRASSRAPSLPEWVPPPLPTGVIPGELGASLACITLQTSEVRSGGRDPGIRAVTFPVMKGQPRAGSPAPLSQDSVPPPSTQSSLFQSSPCVRRSCANVHGALAFMSPGPPPPGLSVSIRRRNEPRQCAEHSRSHAWCAGSRGCEHSKQKPCIHPSPLSLQVKQEGDFST